MTSYLKDIEFPASKTDVISAAEAGGAPQAVIEQLQALRVEQLESADAVEAAVAQQPQ